MDLIREQIARCWNVPAGAREAKDLVVEIRVAVEPDGTVRQAASVANQPPFSEIRTLASGFRDLSTLPSTQPVSRTPPAAVPVAPPPAPPPPMPPRVYAIEDVDVIPPVVIRQSLAALADVFALRSGLLEIIIDEIGEVEVATVRASVNPVYDRLVIATARSWRYRPATLAGVPVKFRKLIELDPKRAR